jgi:hypothetical protein
MHIMGSEAPVVSLTVLTILFAGVAASAQSRIYAGGAVTFLTQTNADGRTEEQLRGTTLGGSVVLGVQVSPRLSVEFEPSFGRSFTAPEYTYRPWIDRAVNVVSTGKDSFFTFQLRGRIGVLEPVVGVSYVRVRSSRRAIYVPGGGTYFDGDLSGYTFALAGGIDAAVKVAPHLYFVPTFRLFIVPRSPLATAPPYAGKLVFRGGAGARVSF